MAKKKKLILEISLFNSCKNKRILRYVKTKTDTIFVKIENIQIQEQRRAT